MSDDVYAATNLEGGETSKYLLGRDIFTSNPIPTSSIVHGVRFFVEKHAEVGALFADASVRLTMNGQIVGTDHSLAGNWPTTDSVFVYGGPTDMWGLSLTPDDINNNSFGFVIAATSNSGLTTPLRGRVDQIMAQIHYIDTLAPCLLSTMVLKFDLRNVDEGALIEWATVNEQQNSHFTISHSTDGIDFEEIARIAGAGNSEELRTYAYTDFFAKAGQHFYKLESTDFEGQRQLIKIAELKPGHQEVKLEIFPVPFENILYVRYDSDMEIKFKIHDVRGRELKHVAIQELVPGAVSITFPAGSPTGVYFLSLLTPQGRAYQRIMKQ